MKYNDLTISTRIILKVIFAFLALLFLWMTRDIILLLLMALILASAMEPLVDYLHHKRIPRGLSVIMVYIVVIGLGVLIVYSMIPPVIEQFKMLLLLILIVAVLKAVMPWHRIASNVPLVKPLDMVMVLLVIFAVSAPVGWEAV